MSNAARFIVICALCVGLPACSSNVTRFDLPMMGMKGQDSPQNRQQYGRQQYAGIEPEKTYKNSYDRSYNPPVKREYQDRYQAQNRYDRSYNQREVYDTASTDYSKNTYDRSDVQRNQLPDISRKTDYQDQAKVEQYNSAPEKQTYAPQQLAANIAKRDPQGRHIVSEGDTLYNISRRYNVTTDELRTANDLQNNDIKLGQHLFIPGLSKKQTPIETRVKAALAKTGRHKVEQGQTAYSISRRYGITTDQLAKANGLTDASQVQLGQELIIPGSGEHKAPVQVASIDRKAGLKPLNPKVAPSPIKKPYERPAKIKTPDSGAGAKLASNRQFLWPANGRIISNFGRQKSGTINDGVNLALPIGTTIKAAENGVVAYAGSELKGYGNLILIRHKNNWVSAYAHNSKLLVKRGQKVTRGQAIAKSGKTGSVHQPQLHFELRKGSKPVNPMKYLAMR